MTAPRISVVTIGADDVAALRRFYAAVGFDDLTPDVPNFASFMAGGVVLALYDRRDLTAEADPGAEPPHVGGFNGLTLACNVDAEDEVDRVWRRWVDAGATPVHEPVDRTPIPVRSGYVADPEGNRWEIAWNAEMTFDERGAVRRFGPGS